MAISVQLKYATLAPHSEAQIEGNIAGGSTLELNVVPQDRDDAMIPLLGTFYDTEPNAFDIAADHRHMKRHEIKLTEDVLTVGWRPLRIVLVTVDDPLWLRIRNRTGVAKFFGMTVHHFYGSKREMAELVRKLEAEMWA